MPFALHWLEAKHCWICSVTTTVDGTYLELMCVPFASDTKDAEAVESLVKSQPTEGPDDMESPQHSSSPDASVPSVEDSRSLPVEDVISGLPSAKSMAESESVADHSSLSENGKDPEITPTNQGSVQVTVSNEADETSSKPLPSGHSPKSEVTWMSLGRRRFNYDIMPKVFYNVKYTLNSVIQL